MNGEESSAVLRFCSSAVTGVKTLEIICWTEYVKDFDLNFEGQ